ncbi:MAG: tryptophan--tRNA ligase [Patescibacteria group bacterium]|nr:tryptophan--tRNA ligase [Patescibacteria group bacterium]
MKKRVLSGIRATGRLHLGNYLGAVKGMIELQNNSEYECLYMVADAHTITTPYNPQELKTNQKEIIIDYLAAGLNPEKSTLFIQSQISEHFELAYYFSSIVSIARMQHLPTYKEKVKQYPKNNTMALLNYPVLMAADILVYKANLVPVGIDQEPHLEVTREIARKMNQTYGTNFPEPKRFSTPGEYIPSLKGEGKMSKSVEGSYINLTDSIDEIRKKIKSIPTATISGGPITGGVKTLFLLAKLFLKESDYQKFKDEYHQGILKFVNIKNAVAEAIYQELKPIQEKRSQIAQNKDYVEKVVKNGAERAKTIASQTLKEVKEKMGLR